MTRAAPYEHWVAWIVRNRGGGNAYPARSSDIMSVSGWKVVQMVADNFHKPANEVAADVIEFDHLHEHGEAAITRPSKLVEGK